MKKRVFNFFWTWKHEQEEKWLEQMAMDGWLFKKYNLFFYTFEKGEPQKYIYRIDFNANSRKNTSDYIALFEDAGWEHVTQFGGWHYFRSEEEQVKSPEIYTDNTSKADMFKRVIAPLIMSLLSILIIAITIVFNPTFSHHRFYFILRIIYIVLIALTMYGIINILFRIKRLKK